MSTLISRQICIKADSENHVSCLLTRKTKWLQVIQSIIFYRKITLLHDFFLCVFFTNTDFTNSIQIRISLADSMNHVSCLQTRVVKLLQVILSIILCRKVTLSHDFFFFTNISFTDSIQIRISLDLIDFHNVFLYFRSL